MRITTTLISVSILALSLAACGAPDPGNPDSETAETTEEAETPAALDTGEEAVVDGADGLGEDGSEDGGEEDASEDATEEVAEAPETTQEPAPAPKPEPSVEPAPAPVAAAVAPPMFAICSACHSVDAGQNGLGPSLAGVGGAKAGHVGSFSYSDAMKESGLTWNAANLDKFLKDPAGAVPGTSMGYGGMSNDAQRKAVVDYLMGL